MRTQYHIRFIIFKPFFLEAGCHDPFHMFIPIVNPYIWLSLCLTVAKRFYRSRNDKILGGVCGGVAHHLDIDPVIVRLLWIFLSFAWGSGIIAYIVCWIIIPLEPKGMDMF